MSSSASNPNTFTLPQEAKAFLDDSLNKENNLIDYFIEVGINPSIITNNSFLNASSITELNALLTPDLICKFPPLDKKTISIDNSLTHHIFPNEYKVVVASSKPSPNFYNIILDNQFYSAVFTSKYITCMIIYESYRQYEKLASYYNNKKITNTNITLPNEDDEIYIPKCIGLVSVYPYFDYFKNILESFYVSFDINDNNEVFFDKVIEKLLIETPSLPRGINTIKLNILDNEFTLYQKRINELPLINFNMKQALECFDENAIIEIYKYLLYETKMVFFSERLEKLTEVIISFITLLFPFKYQFQISSVIPESFYGFIENVTPYVFGINTKYDSAFFNNNNISIDELCIVDIDRGNYVFINTRRNQKEKDFPEIPKRFKSVLDDNLKSIRKTNDYTNYDIQECFFNFLLNVLEPYPKYLKNDYFAVHETNEIASLLNTDSFYNYVGSSDKYFYQKILETQMFIEMMFQRMLPKDSENKLDIIFFEQKISENIDKKKLFKKGKESTPLLNTDEYNFTLYHIIQINNAPNLSEFDKTHIYKETTLKELILKGMKCTISEQTRRVFFTYVLFPSLSTEMFFPYNFNEYMLPPELKLSVDNVNSRMVALSGFQTQKNTMENYIHLSWMLIWALSFSYIKDQKEREYRFEQLLNVVDKVQSHQMEVYEIIFKVFLKTNQENFLLVLYKKILKRLNVSWEMFHTVSNILEKEQKQQHMNKVVKNTTINQNQHYDVKNFRQRILRDNDEYNVLSEDIIFYAYDYCIECNCPINLLEISKDLKNIPDKEMWIKCPECGDDNLLKLNFAFGHELFDASAKEKTRIKDEIALYSPKMLEEKLLTLAESIYKNGKDEEFPISEFKMRYKFLFWNALWYFRIAKLDFSLMLPYDNHAINKYINHDNLIQFVHSIDDYLSQQFEQNNNNNNNSKCNHSNQRKVQQPQTSKIKNKISFNSISKENGEDNANTNTNNDSKEPLKNNAKLIYHNKNSTNIYKANNINDNSNELKIQRVNYYSYIPYIGFITVLGNEMPRLSTMTDSSDGDGNNVNTNSLLEFNLHQEGLQGNVNVNVDLISNNENYEDFDSDLDDNEEDKAQSQNESSNQQNSFNPFSMNERDLATFGTLRSENLSMYEPQNKKEEIILDDIDKDDEQENAKEEKQIEDDKE